MPGWAPPGRPANSARWRYDLRKGFVPPGHATDPEGVQYEMHDGFDPARDKGFHILTSPAGSAAPIDAINYTPDTREVHSPGTLAPVDKVNYSLIPSHRLQQLARTRQSSSMGAGQDGPVNITQPFPGQPPISSGPFSQTQSPQPTGGMPSGGPTIGPGAQGPNDPGTGFWFRAFGAGQDEGDDSETDPLAGGGGNVNAPSSADTGGAPDPDWANVGPEYTGKRRIDSSHQAEFQQGKPVGIWTMKPGGFASDPTAWSFERVPTPTSTSQPARYGGLEFRGDGSIWQQNQTTNEWVQKRGPTPTSTARQPAPKDQWDAPVENEDGSITQRDRTTNEVRQIRPPQRTTAADQQWGEPYTAQDGSVWQENTTTHALKNLQGPVKGTDAPITVGNRLVKFNPDKKQYEEVYKAPSGWSIHSSGRNLVAVNDEDPTQVKNVWADEPGQKADAADLEKTQIANKQAQLNMVPGVSLSGGNIVASPGAQVDVENYNPFTHETSRSQMGTRMSPDELLSAYGISNGTPSPPPQDKATVTPGPSTDAAPPPDPSLLPPGQTGTQNDPTITPYPQAGPTPFPQSGLPEGSSRAMPTPPYDPFGARDPHGELGAGADKTKGSSGFQGDIMSDIPRFAKRRRWKGLGSKFLGRGLDGFDPFVGVGQDDPTNPLAGGSEPASPGALGASTPPIGGGLSGPSSSPMGGPPSGQWKGGQLDPKLIMLLLALLSGGKGGGAPNAAPGDTPAPPTPTGQPPMPGMPGAGQEEYAPEPVDPATAYQSQQDLESVLNRGQMRSLRQEPESMQQWPDLEGLQGSQEGTTIERPQGGYAGYNLYDAGRRLGKRAIPSAPGYAPQDLPVLHGSGQNPHAVEGDFTRMGIESSPNTTEFDPSAMGQRESGPTQLGGWREAGPRILPGWTESGPTIMQPGQEGGPGMLDTSPVSSQAHTPDDPFYPEDFKNLDARRQRTRGELGVDRGLLGGEARGPRFHDFTFPDNYSKENTPDWAGYRERGSLGTGADSPRGRWVPPVDPQQVLGTGHQFGDPMKVGEPQHSGVDLQAPKGTPVKAPVDGVLQVNNNPQGLGLEAIIVAPDGKQHKLGHLSQVMAKPGEQVHAGQVIGAVGDSGMTTGAHLHYAEKKGGRAFDPSKKMGVLASMPPVPGTEMMTQDGMGSGQDENFQRIQTGRAVSRDNTGVDPNHPYGSYEESESLPSDNEIQSFYDNTATPAKWRTAPAPPLRRGGLVQGEAQPPRWSHGKTPRMPDDPSRPQIETPREPQPMYSEHGYSDIPPDQYYPRERVPYYPPANRATVGAGGEAQDLGVGAGGMRLANGNWSDALADTPENQQHYGQGSGFQGSAGYGSTQYGTSSGGGGSGGTPAKPGNTTVGIDPATKARLDLDTQRAQWEHDNQSGQLANQVNAENNRHGEELTRLQQAAQQEADWKSVQQAIAQENTRHNQALEQLQQAQQALDVKLEQMKEQSALQLQQESEKFTAGQTARSNALGILQSALNNPWLQALTKLGINPGGGSSGQNPLMGLLNSILGGQDAGSLQEAGVPGGGLPGTPDLRQFLNMTPAQKAGLRTQVEAQGPGAWQQYQTNFQNQYGNAAPDMTALQAVTQTPEDQVGTQMSADMFGEGIDTFQNRQQKQWSGANAPNVMQSLLTGTGFG